MPPTVAVKIATVETPTHLLGWLPMLWTRVWFAGPAARVEPLRAGPSVFIFLVSGVLLYPCMSFPLFEPDEGRYAQIPREMLTAREWIVPTLQGEPYLDKPPLFYWLVMLSYSIFGYSAGAARLIPALAMHASVLSTYFLGRRIVGARSAFWGALFLTVSPIFLGVGRLLVLDGLLTLWITLGLLAAYLAQAEKRLHWKWWCLAALACALGVLTKGPVAVLLILPPLWIQRRLVSGAPISWRAWLGFYASVLIINLPWYAVVCWQRPEFVRYFLWQHNVERFVEPFDHIRPVWFYAPIVLFGLLPTILLAWPRCAFLYFDQRRRHQPALPGDGLSPARRALVRPLFLAGGKQAADVHLARVSAAVPGAGLFHRPHRSLPIALDDRPRRGVLANAGVLALSRNPALRPPTLWDRPP